MTTNSQGFASFLTTKVAGKPYSCQQKEKLPDSYVWAEEEKEKEKEEEEHPPVLDMAKMQYDDSELVWACREWGLFYVVNHGVKDHSITQMEDEGKRLFNYPLDVKLRAHRAPGSFSGYGKPLVGQYGFDSLLWSECFTYCSAHDYTKHEYHFINRQLFLEYHHALYGLALRLLHFFCLSLGIDMREIDWMREGREIGFVHMNHYPPCPQPSKAMGMPPHTDSSLLTIIQQRKKGLQIIRNNHWMDVSPLDNTFVVQVGDMLQILSNDRYKSVVHRAVVKEEDWRLSIAYFLVPPPLARVKPCVSLSGGEASTYGDVSWQQLVEAKPKHPQGALDIFRLLQKGMKSE